METWEGHTTSAPRLHTNSVLGIETLHRYYKDKENNISQEKYKEINVVQPTKFDLLS